MWHSVGRNLHQSAAHLDQGLEQSEALGKIYNYGDDNYLLCNYEFTHLDNYNVLIIPTWYDPIDGEGDIEYRDEELVSERV